MFLRLAQVYEALYSSGRTSWAGSISNLNSQLDGLKSFLLFVAATVVDKEKNVDIEMVESMLDAKSVDAGALMTGAFVVEDAQGKWQHWSRTSMSIPHTPCATGNSFPPHLSLASHARVAKPSFFGAATDTVTPVENCDENLPKPPRHKKGRV